MKSSSDGYRCLAGKDAGGVHLWSRRGNDFGLNFPRSPKACDASAARHAVDGEIVGDTEIVVEGNLQPAINTRRR